MTDQTTSTKTQNSSIDTETYIALIKMQTRTAAVVLKVIGGLLETIASTNTWKQEINTQAQHLADLYNLVDAMHPPAEYREMHTIVRRSLLKSNQAIKLAFETFAEDPHDVSAWVQVKTMFSASGLLMRHAGKMFDERQLAGSTTEKSDTPDAPPDPPKLVA